MLNRKNRLTAERDFRRIFRRGRRFFVPGLRIVVVQNGLGDSRFGFTVGTKVDKRAVVRNRLQRQMREMVRARVGEIRQGFDCVFVADKKVLGLNFDELSVLVYGLLKKANLLV
ncbi:ribonuclease P protein component [Candidatus Uhrbacteria bacterium]|nr:ribonuclease P protein component [Candidatus Uhrbacteria bacterium]